MKIKLIDKIESLGIDIEEDMLREVLKFVIVEDDISREDIIEELNLDYSGTCQEQIDSMVDVYYYDLRMWAVDNYKWIEQAVENGMTDCKDFHEMIQAGQYEYYNDRFYTNLDDLINDLNNL